MTSASCSDFTTSKGRKLGECNKFSPTSPCWSDVGGSWNDFKYSRARLINTLVERCAPTNLRSPTSALRQQFVKNLTAPAVNLRTLRAATTMNPRENAQTSDLFPKAFSRTLTGQERKYTLQSCSNLTPRIGTRKSSSSIHTSE